MTEITTAPNPDEQGLMRQVLDGAYTQVINGFGIFPPASEVAKEYLANNGGDAKRAADDLIGWQMTKAATSGFLTNLGGIATLPVAIPANISSVLYVQIRMIAAIAIMGGYDVTSDKVRTLVYASLLGSAAVDVLKDAGIKLGEKLTQAAIVKFTEGVAKKMATSVAARLAAKLGLSSAGNLAKLVPIAGGVVGAAIDASATKAIGVVAVKLFLPTEETKAANAATPLLSASLSPGTSGR